MCLRPSTVNCCCFLTGKFCILCLKMMPPLRTEKTNGHLCFLKNETLTNIWRFNNVQQINIISGDFLPVTLRCSCFCIGWKIHIFLVTMKLFMWRLLFWFLSVLELFLFLPFYCLPVLCWDQSTCFVLSSANMNCILPKRFDIAISN